MSNVTQYGFYIPTTEIFPGEDNEQLVIRLVQVINSMALAVNAKDTGYYTNTAFVNGQSWFPSISNTNATPNYHQVYRKVITFGALPDTATTSVAHGITLSASNFFTRIYGVANNSAGSSYLPLPYASPTGANNIELQVNATNVVITTGSDRSAYTAYVILEYSY